MAEPATARAASPSFSLIIPTRNEAEDIRHTLERCLELDYDRKEIIVVDDSSDETPRIVSEYSDRGVRLIHREENVDGCCGARNAGMRAARGDVLVLLNADAVPSPDFLSRLAEHYQQGADWVLVRSRVQNTDTLWCRYLYAFEAAHLDAEDYAPFWSEGASFRRSAAEAVGYIPGSYPVRFCRDNMLGARLTESGCSKRLDRTIVMEHVVPDRLGEFWRHQIWRGTMFPPNFYFFYGMPLGKILLRELAKALRTLAVHGLVIPSLWRARRHARWVGGWRRIPGLALASAVDDCAQSVGSFQALRDLYRAVGTSPPPPAARTLMP